MIWEREMEGFCSSQPVILSTGHWDRDRSHPVHFDLAAHQANGLGSRIQIRWENFYKANLKDADVIFVYATSKEIMKTPPHLEMQMKKGARLVSISADFPEWEPQEVDTRELIFVYEMPPHKGGLATYLAQRS